MVNGQTAFNTCGQDHRSILKSGCLTAKTASGVAAPSVLPHADVYRSGHGRDIPRWVTVTGLDAALGPLGIDDDRAPDLFLALLVAYIARTSSEEAVAIGYVSGIVREIVPLGVAVNDAEPFSSLVDRVSAARREIETESPFGTGGADLADDDLSPRQAWAQPAVTVSFDGAHSEAVAASSQLGIVIDRENRLVRWCCPWRAAPRFIDTVIAHLGMLARSICADPRAALACHDYLSPDEKEKIVVEWNDTAREYPYVGGLVARFDAQVARAATHPAVIFAGKRVSYGELNVRIERLARHLRRRGVRGNTFVGICMERSVEMVIAVFAILKAGGAYVPLSPEDPPARLAAIIADAGLRLVVTQEELAAALPESGVQPIILTADPCQDPEADGEEDLAALAIDPDDLAYMIYTSGSTGEPKGVLIQHKAIFNRIVWMQETYRLTPADRVLQKTPYTFDVSVWEFLWPLTVGATLVVAEPGGHVVPSYLSRLIRQENVTCCHFVPSVLRLFLVSPKIETLPLRMVFCSGEALPIDVQRLFMSRSRAELHNLYGPTEAAVDVSWWRCRRDVNEGRVPIGKPIANIQLYILDKNLRPVAAGVPGELYIAGIGLAKGYWRNPQLTAERFVANPLAGGAGARMYKTGDVARFLPDGNIEYLGRNDDQVKINGVRMELGEIESVIRKHPAIRDVVVVARPTAQGSAQLAAYLVAATGASAEAVLDDLRRHIVRLLPPPMIPRDLAFIAGIPLTRNGKADRKALLAAADGRQPEAVA